MQGCGDGIEGIELRPYRASLVRRRAVPHACSLRGIARSGSAADGRGPAPSMGNSVADAAGERRGGQGLGVSGHRGARDGLFGAFRGAFR